MITTTLFEKIEQWLNENKWEYRSRENAGIIEIDMGLKCELKQCQVIVWMKEGQCVVMGRVPIKAEEDARERIAEYFCRVNYGLYSGHFDLNYSDGEIRYKTYLPESTDPDAQRENIGETLIRPAMMFDAYGPGMMKVWRQEKDPAQAMEEM